MADKRKEVDKSGEISKNDPEEVTVIGEVTCSQRMQIVVSNPFKVAVPSIDENDNWDEKKKQAITRGQYEMVWWQFDGRLINVYLRGNSWIPTLEDTGVKAKLCKMNEHGKLTAEIQQITDEL